MVVMVVMVMVMHCHQIGHRLSVTVFSWSAT